MIQKLSQKFDSFKVPAALIFTITTWSSAFVGIRAGLEGYHPGSLALLRFIFASLAMAFLYARSTSPKRLPSPRDFARICILGLTGYAIYNVALNYGETTVTAGIASFIMSLAPVFVILLANIFLGERLSLFQWTGVLTSIIGITVIAFGRDGFEKFDAGVFFILAAGLSAAVYMVLQKPMLKSFSALHLTTYGIWVGTLLLLVYSPTLFEDIQTASLASTLSVIYLGIFPAALGFLAWSYFLSNYDASKAIMYLYWMPIFATFFSWLLLNEVPTPISFSGGIIALLGALMVNFKRK